MSNTTCSRYDFMKPGLVVDEVTGSYYPDPLSINYLDLEIKDNPTKDRMSSRKISYFWKEAENIYGAAGYDDIVLTVNGYAHKHFLQQGDTVYFPSTTDIQTSYAKER